MFTPSTSSTSSSHSFLRKLWRLAAVTVFMSAAGLAELQGATYTGILTNIDADGDTLADDLPIFRYSFDVTAGATVTFDSLVWDYAGLDWNNDGLFTGFDMYFRLYNGANVNLGDNDDYTVGDPFDTNGSTHPFDSALAYTFASAGSYYLSFGQLAFSDAQALQGYEPDEDFFDYEGSDGEQNFAAWQLDVSVTGGTLSNESITGGTLVPQPGSVLSLALLIGGCAVVRSRRRVLAL